QQVPTTLFRWLQEVSLPYHADRRHLISHNYTHYRCLITLATRTYRFIPRTTKRPSAPTKSLFSSIWQPDYNCHSSGCSARDSD
ncbi:hypothetical protein WP50_36810, partial [Lactiplantibacillus plantarum]